MLDWRLRKGLHMVRRLYTAEQIINKLREAVVSLHEGASIAAMTRKRLDMYGIKPCRKY